MLRTYTVDDVREILHVSSDTALAWCKSGKLPATRIGRRWLIDADKLDEMLKSRMDERWQ